MHLIFFAALILINCFCTSTRAANFTTLSIYPSADTTLMENFPSNNFGGGPYLNSGSIQNGSLPPPYVFPRNRGLIRFDVASQIPRGSKIISVSLMVEVVYVSNDNPGSSARYDLHRVLRPWGEGNKVTYIDPPRFSTNGIGAPATLGEANWLYRMAMTTNTWSIPGGEAGIDYATNFTASQFISGPISSPYYFLSELSTNLISEIQDWLDHPDTNFGWIMKARNEADAWTARRFGSREGTTSRLDVQFIAPPKFDFVEIAANEIRFTLTAEAGNVYALEYRDSLSSGNWSTFTTISLPNITAQVILTDSLSATGSRFYRLRVF